MRPTVCQSSKAPPNAAAHTLSIQIDTPVVLVIRAMIAVNTLSGLSAGTRSGLQIRPAGVAGRGLSDYYAKP